MDPGDGALVVAVQEGDGLGKIGSVEVFERLLGDDRRDLRCGAAGAVRRVGDDEAGAKVRDFLEAEGVDTRFATQRLPEKSSASPRFLTS